jgi:hypothetical protein
MRLSADSAPFYTSGVFLGVAGIAVGLIFGVIGVWAAFKAANPLRALPLQLRAVVPLLTSAVPQASDEVEIRVDGQILQYPQVVELKLANRNRRDIPTEAFDQHRPLCIDVGVPIVKILNRVDTPAGVRLPNLTYKGRVLALGPDLFKRGQSVTISLLVDGKEPIITIPESPFIDIDVPLLSGDSRPGLAAATLAAVVATAKAVAAKAASAEARAGAVAAKAAIATEKAKRLR